jgi:hypothetical protein
MMDSGEFFRHEDQRASTGESARLSGAFWVDDDTWIEAELPCRPWVAPGYMLRGGVAIIAGPPSAMKSSLMLAWACAVALGHAHGRFRPVNPGTVIVYNVEDDQTEQRRRLSAVLRQFDVLPGDIADKVVRVGPVRIGTLFHAAENGRLTPTEGFQRLRNLIAERRPTTLIADPLAELHAADENDNTGLRAVIAEFRTIATEFNIAVVLVHHTRKGGVAPGDPDSARGASSIIGAARIVQTITGMSEDDAKAFGIAEDRKTRSRYIRLDDAKQNYAGLDDPAWYEKVLYTLANGEIVPAAVPWSPPDVWASIPVAVANVILNEIESGLDDGKRRYSDAPRAGDRAAWRVAQRHVPSLTEEQARRIITTWRTNKVLRVVEYDDPDDRRKRQGLALNPARRPGNVSQ